MRRASFCLVLVSLLSLVLAGPVSAAKPTIISFDDDDVADSAFFTEVCGFPVTAESKGHVIIHNPKSGAATEIFNWNINIWLHSESGSYHLLDAGPDMLLTKAGTTYFTVTGRSITFSTVIGRVEVNLETGEVTWHGKLVGDEVFDPEWWEPICDALA